MTDATFCDDTRAHELFYDLEDALAAGWRVPDGRVPLEDLAPLLETARALLMLWRGREPVMPKKSTA